MANKSGVKWNKGGAMARKRKIDIDFSSFGELAEQLENLGANVEKVFGAAMEETGKQIAEDTIRALDDAYLPASGAYSNGDTRKSVVEDPKVEWRAGIGEMPLGFDKTVMGAGGWLITGTPKMRPDKKLEDIYSRKKTSRSYQTRIKKQIEATLRAEIEKRLGG